MILHLHLGMLPERLGVVASGRLPLEILLEYVHLRALLGFGACPAQPFLAMPLAHMLNHCLSPPCPAPNRLHPMRLLLNLVKWRVMVSGLV